MRRVALTVLMILSFFICAFVAGSLLGGSSEKPRWTISRPDVLAGNCKEAHQRVSNPEAVIMTNYDEAELSRWEANNIADAAFEKLWKQDDHNSYEGTEMVLATLPNDEERLVWSRLWIPDWQGRNAEILYIDADSGEILVHYTDFRVSNPSSYTQGCSYNYSYDFEKSFSNPGATAIAIFAIAIPVLLGGFILWRRYQSGAFV